MQAPPPGEKSWSGMVLPTLAGGGMVGRGRQWEDPGQQDRLLWLLCRPLSSFSSSLSRLPLDSAILLPFSPNLALFPAPIKNEFEAEPIDFLQKQPIWRSCFSSGFFFFFFSGGGGQASAIVFHSPISVFGGLALEPWLGAGWALPRCPILGVSFALENIKNKK